MSSVLEPDSTQCQNDCHEPGSFPKTIENRPGLLTIDYRIGDYSSMREFLLKKIDVVPALSGWTYRSPDDPAIALLEGAAILGDILTYYQKLYANEGYLVSAKWRESIYDLVRLTGYMLSPPIGGTGYFNFIVKGEKSVLIPANFPLKAKLDGPEKPGADFETIADFTAYPELGDFTLYRPVMQESITKGVSRFMVYGEVDLKEGDLLFLGAPEGGLEYYEKKQIAEVEKVEEKFGGAEITIEGSWQDDSVSGSLDAVKLGRNYRYFGYNVPNKVPVIQSDSMVVMTNTGDDVLYQNLYPEIETPSGTLEKRLVFQLDQKVDDITAGSRVLMMLKKGLTSEEEVSLKSASIHSVSATEATHEKVEIIEGESTKLVLEDFASPLYDDELKIAIRSSELWEVIGETMTFEGAWVNAGAGSDAFQLCFFGTFASYQALNSRAVAFKKDDLGEQLTSTIDTSAVELQREKDFYPVIFSPGPEEFTLDDFPLEDSGVHVYGNLTYAIQGKIEREKILGNGDASQTFQTFKIPKKDLTYHSVNDASPPEVPELKVYVNEIEWSLVSSFFNSGPEDEVYVIRRDHGGINWIQFGDGKTGARLPSGVGNIKIKYKTGTGAYGPKQEESKVQASSPLKPLKEIDLPGPAFGGATEEGGDSARFAAPGKIQSLDRLVSLQDYETEAGAIAGVLKASARWTLFNGVPVIAITVLMESGRSEEIGAVTEKMQKLNEAKGSLRHSVEVIEATFQYLYLDVTVSIGAKYRQSQVEPELIAALGTPGIQEKVEIIQNPGLFAVQKRKLGQREYLNNVAAVLQNVEAVEWVEVHSFGALAETTPEELLLAQIGAERLDKIECNKQTLLMMHKEHVKITFASVQEGGNDE